ncbi:unnamed protein product [Dovyalis caffra]|uniref:GH16 domain-containing protein n=1 Tax=Dovyalis caffra TaxID=77055 RepID=A0AAV1SAV7_9ROSI|nr:unnamed protein product [Dovyalis caffra]
MADPALHQETKPINQIAIDYTPEACTHCPESNSITLTYDRRGGSRWRSTTRFLYGTFSSLIQCPKGNTSGLNFNIYLSSLEGDKSQDEIDFEFIGKDKTIVQTNYYTTGTGNREEIHELGFDCSDGFHEYVIKWCPYFIEWLIDGKVVRKVDKREGEGFPEKPMFLYASIWDASYIEDARWTGPYVGCDAPYVCLYKDIRVPIGTAKINGIIKTLKEEVSWKKTEIIPAKGRWGWEMFDAAMNLITTVIGFGMSVTFILFVCTRIICGRLRGAESRQMFEIESRIDLEQPEHRISGLEPVLVAAIPTLPFTREAFNSAEDAQCSICLGEYQEKEVLRIMPKCGHNFHLSCIDVWLRKQSTCPVCRFPIQDSFEAKHTRQTAISMAQSIGSRDTPSEYSRQWPLPSYQRQEGNHSNERHLETVHGNPEITPGEPQTSHS